MKYLLSVVVGIILGAGGVLVVQPTQQPQLGAASGVDHSNKEFFHGNMEVGGGVLATTSQGAVTYTAAQVMNSKVIEHVASAALTATLPTAASLSSAGFIKNPGDTFTLFIHASTTAITIAGGTGMSLQSASSTKAIPAGNTGRLDFTRLPATEGGRIDVLLSSD